MVARHVTQMRKPNGKKHLNYESEMDSHRIEKELEASTAKYQIPVFIKYIFARYTVISVAGLKYSKETVMIQSLSFKLLKQWVY